MTPIRNEKQQIIGYRQEQPAGQVKIRASTASWWGGPRSGKRGRRMEHWCPSRRTKAASTPT